MRCVLLGLLLLAVPAYAVEPVKLSSEMEKRVRATQTLVGDLAPTPAPQAPASLTLKECLDSAAKHNADFRQDQERLVEAQRGLWVAQQSVYYTATGLAQRDKEPGGVAGDSFAAGFNTRWENARGGSLNALLSSGTQDAFGDLFSERPSLSLTYSLPLLRGAGLASSTAEQIRRARTGLQAQELSFYDAYEALAQTIVEDYQAVLLAEGQVGIAERAVERAKQFAERNNVLFTGEGVDLPPGVEWQSRVTVMDVGQSKLDLERAKQDLISQQQAYRDAVDRMLLDMGLQPGAQPKLTSKLPYVPRELDEASLIETGLANSTELCRLDLSRQDAEAALRVARSEARPDVTASFGLSDLGETRGGVSFDQGWLTGLAVQMPLRDRGREERVAAAERALKVLEQRIIATREQVAQEVRRQVRAATSSRARIDIGEQSKALAEQNRAAAQAMFDEGLSDSLQVVDAEQRLVQAERSLLQDQAQYYSTIVRLRRALGEDITQGLPE